jgi:GDP-L-fucose synthase
MPSEPNSRSRVYVAGHRGLAGSAIVRRLLTHGYRNLLLRSHTELDLTDQAAVARFFEHEKPEYVVLAAAKVGGIVSNSRLPAEFIYQNLAIQNNVIHESWRAGTRRLLFLGSSCIYPRDCPQPIREEYLLTGPLEPTNRPYAIAKIAGIEMCWSYNRQYATEFLALMPTNLYGPNDNYDLETSHVLPSLIRKMHEAKQLGSPEVAVWGSGTPRREFLYSDDMADACAHLLSLPDPAFRALSAENAPPLVNIGCGEDMTVAELASTIARVVGYRGALAFDTSKPDGTPRKLLDSSSINALGWRPATPLQLGIELAYRDYLETRATKVLAP